MRGINAASGRGRRGRDFRGNGIVYSQQAISMGQRIATEMVCGDRIGAGVQHDGTSGREYFLRYRCGY